MQPRGVRERCERDLENISREVDKRGLDVCVQVIRDILGIPNGFVDIFTRKRTLIGLRL